MLNGGRFWGRTGCFFDVSGKGKCETGDCGGLAKWSGVGGQPPATLAEFSLGPPLDFYDVSLVDGYNVHVSMEPRGGQGARAADVGTRGSELRAESETSVGESATVSRPSSCNVAGCIVNVNTLCPTVLRH